MAKETVRMIYGEVQRMLKMERIKAVEDEIRRPRTLARIQGVTLLALAISLMLHVWPNG